MALFCLVHGSTQSAAGWKLLKNELQKRGHETICATLPADTPEAGGMEYAEIISRALENTKERAFVVAHSASGLFLPLIPSFRPVAHLVFLTAVIPQIGKSLLQQIQSEPKMLWPDWRGKDPTEDDALARHFLFHDCDEATARWALTTRRRMIPRRAMTEVCPITKWPDVASSYIVGRDDRTIHPDWSRRTARKRLGQPAIELPGGHAPHVSRPAELAEILVGLAKE